MSMQAFDSIAMARDLVARDEALRVFDVVAREYDRVKDTQSDDPTITGSGYLSALRFVMDDLDERIGHLRDKWE